MLNGSVKSRRVWGRPMPSVIWYPAVPRLPPISSSQCWIFCKAKRYWPAPHTPSLMPAPIWPICCCGGMDGVLRIRDSKLLMFQAPREAMNELLQLLPDARAAHEVRGGWCIYPALQALCHGAMTWQRLKDLARWRTRLDGVAGGTDAGMKRVDWNVLMTPHAWPCCSARCEMDALREVQAIFAEVAMRGDAALRDYTQQFDGRGAARFRSGCSRIFGGRRAGLALPYRRR